MKPLFHNCTVSTQTAYALKTSKKGHLMRTVKTLLSSAAYFILALIVATTFVACHDHDHHRPPVETPQNSGFITVDSADKMIASYLASINCQQTDTNLCSMIFNADTLRAYLANTNIKDVKLMFAHTLDYINNGGQNQSCGYRRGALTIILAAYDASGNYVLYTTPTGVQEVMDHAIPCPTACPPNGSAAANIIPPANSKHDR